MSWLQRDYTVRMGSLWLTSESWVYHAYWWTQRCYDLILQRIFEHSFCFQTVKDLGLEPLQEAIRNTRCLHLCQPYSEKPICFSSLECLSITRIGKLTKMRWISHFLHEEHPRWGTCKLIVLVEYVMSPSILVVLQNNKKNIYVCWLQEIAYLNFQEYLQVLSDLLLLYTSLSFFVNSDLREPHALPGINLTDLDELKVFLSNHQVPPLSHHETKRRYYECTSAPRLVISKKKLNLERHENKYLMRAVSQQMP